MEAAPSVCSERTMQQEKNTNLVQDGVSSLLVILVSDSDSRTVPHTAHGKTTKELVWDFSLCPDEMGISEKNFFLAHIFNKKSKSKDNKHVYLHHCCTIQLHTKYT